MIEWKISKKERIKILAEALKLDKNDMRILFLLRNLGPQRFTSLIELSGLSRGTISKYLRFHLSQNNIEKKIYTDPSSKIQDQRYFITELGIERINELDIDKKGSRYFQNLNSYLSQLNPLIDFYKEIGVADSIVFNIIRTISKVGDDFFLKEQNRDLYLSLFFMYLNSVLTKDFKFEIREFCNHHNVKKLRIDYYIDKIMSNNFGFYMFNRGEDSFFFHEDDLLGTCTLRLIKDALHKEIVQVNLNGFRKIYDLDKTAEKIATKMLRMELIWDADEKLGIKGIREPFEMLIEKMLIKTALDMGFSRPFLMDIALQSEKLAKSKEGLQSLINIINGSERYEDLNIVSIHERKSKDLDEMIEKIQGFCPNCGKTILETDLLKKCPRCANALDFKTLIQDINSASEISMAFKRKSMKEEMEIECPNPSCRYSVKINWGECPNCGTRLKDDTRKN